jgi:hypothetical protein
MKRARARAARAITMVMRVAGEKEGDSSKAMALAARVAGKQTATAVKGVMTMKMTEAGKEEGNGNCGKSNGDGKEDDNGDQQRQQP